MPVKNDVECQYLIGDACSAVSNGEGKKAREEHCSARRRGYAGLKDLCCHKCNDRQSCKISCAFLGNSKRLDRQRKSTTEKSDKEYAKQTETAIRQPERSVRAIYVPSLTEIDNYGKEKVSSFDRALACAYIRVENERKKGKGFLFKQPEEEISFLIQIHWPFVLMGKSSKKCAVFDMAGHMKRYFHDGDTTKSDEFTDQIQKCVPSLMSRPDFHENLQTFASYFKDFDKKKSHEIIGCFQEPEKARDIANSLNIGGSLEINEAFCLPIVVDSKKANESVVFLSELRKKAENDTTTLNEMLSPLDSILPKWHQQIDDEIKQKRLPYDTQIEEITPLVESKISKIEKEKRAKLAPLEPEISRLESDLTQLKEFEETRNVEEKRAWDEEIEAASGVDQENEDIREAREALEIEQRRSYDDPERDLRIPQLESRVSHARSRLSRAEDRLGRAEETRRQCVRAATETHEKVWKAEDILRDKRNEYENIKDEYDEQIADEEAKITNLEEERDSIIASLNQEAQSLTDKVGTIRSNVNHLISRKQNLISEIDSNYTYFAQNPLHQGIETYAYIPFFLAMLSENAVARRFVVISPARLRKDRSTTEKLGGFILAKVPTLTERRDQTLSSFAHILHDLLQTDHAVRKEICEKAGKLSLINLKHTRESLLKGIDSLWSDGILNDRMTQKLKSNLSVRRV